MSSAFDEGRRSHKEALHRANQESIDVSRTVQERLDTWHPRFIEIVSPIIELGYGVEYANYFDTGHSWALWYAISLPSSLAPKNNYRKRHHRPDLEIVYFPEATDGFKLWMNDGNTHTNLSSVNRVREYCEEQYGSLSHLDLTEEQFLQALGYWHEINVEYAAPDTSQSGEKSKKRFGLF